MAKKNREKAETSSKVGKTQTQNHQSLTVKKEAVDPSLALLFASSAGPVKAPPKTRYEQEPPSTKKRATSAEVDESSEVEIESRDEDDEELSSVDDALEDGSIQSLEEDASSSRTSDGITPADTALDIDATKAQSRKRKRKANEDDLEGKYMLRLAKEEEKEEQARQAERLLKRQKLIADQNLDEADNMDPMDVEEVVTSDMAEKVEAPLDIPQHETLVADKDATELEKAGRTVFLANVSSTAITDKKAKKTLLEHMGSFLESLTVQEGKPQHKVESIRFRSTAYAGNSLPKKASFAKKNLMEATTKSTNAYVVYSTPFAAREAVKRLNGTVVLDRHLRVDGVAHPAKTDHRRCVFVGNLGFVDDESMMDQGGEGERKRSKIPSDIEEGLWRQFGKAGKVESVRVVRDEKTRVGKGFAYVQFEDPNAVEAALLFHEKKYPPMLPRVLRVTRAKAVQKTALASQRARPSSRPLRGASGNPNRERIYNPKISGQQQSLQGRAGKLLGRAGAARFKTGGATGDSEAQPNKRLEGIAKTPESIVFEGYRATAKSGKPKDLKLGGKGGGKKKGKPRTRSSNRASAWKKGGGKGAK